MQSPWASPPFLSFHINLLKKNLYTEDIHYQYNLLGHQRLFYLLTLTF